MGFRLSELPELPAQTWGNRTPKLRALHQFWNFSYIEPAPSSLPTSPYSRSHNLKVPFLHDKAIRRPYRGLEAPGFGGPGSGTFFIPSCRRPYRAISASISFRRSSPLLPGMLAPGPGTTGPPAPGSPGSGPAPAIAPAFAVAAPTRASSGSAVYSRGWSA